MILLFFIFQPLFSQEFDRFVDKRDGEEYVSVKIENQIWMAQNLNFDTASCWIYNEDKENAMIYGRLYHWKDAQKVCPEGWHLPNATEWDELVTYLGGISISGAKLKKRNEVLWIAPNRANNKSGFSAIPGGFVSKYGKYNEISKIATFWSASSSSALKISVNFGTMKKNTKNTIVVLMITKNIG